MTHQQALMVISLAATGSFTRTAEELSLTQPAVSAGVKALEREFHCTLFERTTSHVRPTPAGEALLRHAEALVGALEEMRRDMRRFDRRGSLVIGCHRMMVFYNPDGFEAFKSDLDREASDRDARCVIVPSFLDGVEQLRRREIDFLVAKTDAPELPPSRFRSLGVERSSTWACVRSDDPVAALPSVRASDLAGRRIVLYHDGIRPFLEDVLGAICGGDRSALDVVETDTFAFAQAKVLDEGAVCPTPSAFRDVPGLSYVPVTGLPDSMVGVVWRRDSGDGLDDVAAVVARCLKSAFPRDLM